MEAVLQLVERGLAAGGR